MWLAKPVDDIILASTYVEFAVLIKRIAIFYGLHSIKQYFNSTNMIAFLFIYLFIYLSNEITLEKKSCFGLQELLCRKC
jgi:hypothetical protein